MVSESSYHEEQQEKLRNTVKEKSELKTRTFVTPEEVAESIKAVNNDKSILFNLIKYQESI